ncbi:MAG: DnaD domain protein [Dehalococcoidia bacterium]|nr:DnaD domain protein [Dehalococcoidia bacterium]MDD5647359.1 DnaD domain protein [Dehalococcoidia bacterium]
MQGNSFKGFPPRVEVTPLPNVFFSQVLSLIDSLLELKTVMQIFFLLSRRRGYPRFVSFSELSHNAVIEKELYKMKGDADVLLRDALLSAVKHGILLHIPINVDEKSDDAYFINNQVEKNTIDKILSGTLKIPSVEIRSKEEPASEQSRDIYSLYERNIGMLTPILAEELQEAEHRYPPEWIEDAFREALRANVRNWKYINSILKRWEREGKKDGKPVGDTQKERDPDKYIRGKYGHMVRR